MCNDTPSTHPHRTRESSTPHEVMMQAIQKYMVYTNDQQREVQCAFRALMKHSRHAAEVVARTSITPATSFGETQTSDDSSNAGESSSTRTSARAVLCQRNSSSSSSATAIGHTCDLAPVKRTAADALIALVHVVKESEKLFRFLFKCIYVHQMQANMELYHAVECIARDELDACGDVNCQSNSSSNDTETVADEGSPAVAHGSQQDKPSSTALHDTIHAARYTPWSVHRAHARYLARLSFSLHQTSGRSNNNSGNRDSNTSCMQHQQQKDSSMYNRDHSNLIPRADQAEGTSNVTCDGDNSMTEGRSSTQNARPSYRYALQSGEPVSSGAATARLFAISSRYSATDTALLLFFITRLFRGSAVVLPVVPNEECAAVGLGCRYLVTPTASEADRANSVLSGSQSRNYGFYHDESTQPEQSPFSQSYSHTKDTNSTVHGHKMDASSAHCTNGNSSRKGTGDGYTGMPLSLICSVTSAPGLSHACMPQENGMYKDTAHSHSHHVDSGGGGATGKQVICMTREKLEAFVHNVPRFIEQLKHYQQQQAAQSHDHCANGRANGMSQAGARQSDAMHRVAEKDHSQVYATSDFDESDNANVHTNGMMQTMRATKEDATRGSDTNVGVRVDASHGMPRATAEVRLDLDDNNNNNSVRDEEELVRLLEDLDCAMQTYRAEQKGMGDDVAAHNTLRNQTSAVSLPSSSSFSSTAPNPLLACDNASVTTATGSAATAKLLPQSADAIAETSHFSSFLLGRDLSAAMRASCQRRDGGGALRKRAHDSTGNNDDDASGVDRRSRVRRSSSSNKNVKRLRSHHAFAAAAAPVLGKSHNDVSSTTTESLWGNANEEHGEAVLMSLDENSAHSFACESQRIAYQRPTPQRLRARSSTHAHDAGNTFSRVYEKDNSTRGEGRNSSCNCNSNDALHEHARHARREVEHHDSSHIPVCSDSLLAASLDQWEKDVDANTQSSNPAISAKDDALTARVAETAVPVLTAIVPPLSKTIDNCHGAMTIEDSRSDSNDNTDSHDTTASRFMHSNDCAATWGRHERSREAAEEENGDEEQDSNYGGVFVPAAPQDWLFQLSNSLKEQKLALVEHIRQLGSEVNLGAAYCPRATHLVFLPGVTERTEKYLSFCAAGKPIVGPHYIVESMRRGYWLRGDVARYDLNPRRRLLHYAQPGCALFTHRPFRAWSVVLLVSNRAIGAGIGAVLGAGGCTRVCYMVGGESVVQAGAQEAIDASVVPTINETASHRPTATTDDNPRAAFSNPALLERSSRDSSASMHQSSSSNRTNRSRPCGAGNGITVPQEDDVVLCHESNVAALTVFRECTHILVECTTMHACSDGDSHTLPRASHAVHKSRDGSNSSSSSSSRDNEDDNSEEEKEAECSGGSFVPPAWLPPELYTLPLYRRRLYTLELLPYCLCSSPEDVFDDETGKLIHANRLVSTCRIAREDVCRRRSSGNNVKARCRRG